MGAMLEMALRYDVVMPNETPQNTAFEVREDPDIELVSKARAGDEAAFRMLVYRYRNQVRGLAHHYLRNHEDSWDASQEVFIKAHRSLGSFRGEASFKSWLLRITANHCKDVLKKRRLDTVPLDEKIDPGNEGGVAGGGKTVETNELGQLIDKALNTLTPKHREAFVFREYQGLSYEEMAVAMECNLGTVMSRLHHARKNMQKTLISMGVAEV
jgi:RNA polymerase sigma-70 factor (ECF subfamily)